MSSIRYGIVGCAGIGPTHADGVQNVDGAELVACADLDESAGNEFAAAYDCAAFTDTTAMIEAADVDAVSVCTPSGTHAEVTIEAARAGAHVLCEKPLDVYAERIDRMIEVCEDEGVTLAGVYQKRTHESARRAKRAIDEGDLGDLVLGDTHAKLYRSQSYYDSGSWRGTREMDGGCLMNQAIHEIDQLQWLMGGVESVQAYTDTLARDLECEDTAAIAVRFENGAVGTIEASTATKGGTKRTEINGTEGTIALDEQDILTYEVGTGEGGEYNAETRSVDVDLATWEWGEAHRRVIEDFVESIREGREPMVTGREGRTAIDVILAAYESSETGERVDIADVRGV